MNMKQEKYWEGIKIAAVITYMGGKITTIQKPGLGLPPTQKTE